MPTGRFAISVAFGAVLIGWTCTGVHLCEVLFQGMQRFIDRQFSNLVWRIPREPTKSMILCQPDFVRCSNQAMMRSYGDFHNLSTSLTSTYSLLFRDEFCAELCTITELVFSFCDERLLTREHLKLGLLVAVAGCKGRSLRFKTGR